MLTHTSNRRNTQIAPRALAKASPPRAWQGEPTRDQKTKKGSTNDRNSDCSLARRKTQTR